MAGPAAVTLCYHLTFQIAHGPEPGFRTASARTSWSGRLFKAAEVLIRRYLGDIVHLLSETRFRIVDGVVSIDVLSIVVQTGGEFLFAQEYSILVEEQIWHVSSLHMHVGALQTAWQA